jgi:hypothetical protein
MPCVALTKRLQTWGKIYHIICVMALLFTYLYPQLEESLLYKTQSFIY